MSHARETLYPGILHVYVSQDTMDNSGMSYARGTMDPRKHE